MTLARFLAEVRTRARATLPDDVDPIGVILTRVGVNPHTVESNALRKAVLAVITTEGDMSEADLWALGKDALGLLDAFAAHRLTERYSARELEIYADRLRGGDGVRLRQYDSLERELRRPHSFISSDRDGNARMSWAGYLLCAATAALALGVGWWGSTLL